MRARIALPLLIGFVLAGAIALLGYSLGAWSPPHGTNAPVAAALLTATGTAMAACVAALVWEYKAQLDREVKEAEERRLRDERVRDTVIAIDADIDSDLALLAASFAPELIEAQMSSFDMRVADSDPHPLPRSVQSNKRLVLAAIEKDISLLPAELIRPVLRYYELDMDMGELLERFAEGKFDSLRPSRQRELLSNYLMVGQTATQAAEAASSAVKTWLGASQPLRPAE